ncbi:hypothetical protein KL864_31010 [Mycolicibacterium goodii]|uniref:hypothetical protein n=1 Tax=Mycolicibacterium goodii TaxID=134601 RepID=UPI001BDCBFDC|nr:hypothetical protein [Mycolicibacterium goodii]MBU8820312.1 hypothetical protein [Mycolicibacterium goodii]
MRKLRSAEFDVAISVSAIAGCVEHWSITIDDQTIGGSSAESRHRAIAAMLHTPADSDCVIPGVGTIRVPHPHAAMVADVMMLDSRHSYHLSDSARLAPYSPETREFLDPFYAI